LSRQSFTQREYQHCVSPQESVAAARIILSFHTLALGM